MWRHFLSRASGYSPHESMLLPYRILRGCARGEDFALRPPNQPTGSSLVHPVRRRARNGRRGFSPSCRSRPDRHGAGSDVAGRSGAPPRLVRKGKLELTTAPGSPASLGVCPSHLSWRGKGAAGSCKAAGMKKPEAYSLEYGEDFFGPRTTQMPADRLPQQNGMTRTDSSPREFQKGSARSSPEGSLREARRTPAPCPPTSPLTHTRS